MANGGRRRVINDETGEIAQETSAMNLGGLAAGLASAIALIFSGISLYHSVLKQPELKLYVPKTLHYSRDPSNNGEVFILPITVANHGARDGTVLGFTLTAQAITATGGDAGPPKVFEATYRVGEDYFVKAAGFNAQTRSFDRVDRPREPFAPVSVAGRSHFSGTLLFYRQGSDGFPRVVDEAGRYRLVLEPRTVVDETLGVIDRALTHPVRPVTLVVETRRRADENRLKRGATLEMKHVAATE
jgi:hypothetical protein